MAGKSKRAKLILTAEELEQLERLRRSQTDPVGRLSGLRSSGATIPVQIERTGMATMSSFAISLFRNLYAAKP